jgi:Flp pilus assembly protein TadB
MAAFFHSGFGTILLVAVGLLEIMGALVIRKIINIDV